MGPGLNGCCMGGKPGGCIGPPIICMGGGDIMGGGMPPIE